jgi:hypothetical protein
LQSTCSQVASVYHLRWFLSEHVFSFWRLVSFLVAFVRTLVPRLQVCIVFAGFVQVRAPILKAWSTCFLTGRLYRLRWGVFRSTCSHIFFSGSFSEHLFSYLKFVSF